MFDIWQFSTKVPKFKETTEPAESLVQIPSKYSFKFHKSNTVLANQIFVEQEAVK